MLLVQVRVVSLSKNYINDKRTYIKTICRKVFFVKQLKLIHNVIEVIFLLIFHILHLHKSNWKNQYLLPSYLLHYIDSFPRILNEEL